MKTISDYVNNGKQRVTILIPTTNRESLKDAVISVFRQSYNFKADDIYNCRTKFLIYHDGGKENDIATSFTRMRYSNQEDCMKILWGKKNKGIAYARNVLLDNLDTEFGAWQDDDDESHEKRIERQVRYMDNNPNCSFCCTLMKDFPIKRNEVESYVTIQSLTYKKLLKGNEIPNPTVLFRSDAAKRFRYNESITRGSDWDYWKQVYKSGLKVECISKTPLYNYHVRHKNQ